MNSIEEFVKKYKDFFLKNDMDVSHSLKGKWYFSMYNAEFDYYDCFIEFETLEQLVDIIIGEVAFHLNCAIERETEIPPFERDGLTDILTGYHRPDIRYDELEYLLDAIVKSELGNIELFKYLKEYLQIKKKISTEK